MLTETAAGSGVFEGDLPTVNGAGAGPTMGAVREDEIVVTYTDALSATGPGQVRTARTTLLDGARLRTNKSVSVVGGGQAVPGADVLYRIEVANDGFGPTNADSLFFVDPLPPLDFLVGDPVTGDGDVAPVLFTQAGAGLAYDYAADVRFAGPGPAPTDLADCPLSPAPGYTAGLGYLCVRPRGSMGAGDPDPRFTLTFRMRIP